jgi:DNA-binding response OmpR family regulator
MAADLCEACGSVIESFKQVELGDLTLCTDALELRCRDHSTHVPLRMAEFLADLMKGRVISYEGALLRHFPDAASDNTVKVCVHKLRRQLLELGSAWTIKNIWGVGYQMIEDQGEN